MRSFLLGLSCVATTACGTTDAPTGTPAEAPSIIEVTRSGNPDGRTVLLVPGLASSADVWEATLPLLEADYDVRTIQVAGFSGADPVTIEGLYTDAISAALVGELRENPANAAVLVGHSMGGFVSIKAALAAPDMIDELVIVDSVPFLAGLFFPGATPEMAAAQAPVMAAQMADIPRAAFDAQQAVGLPRLVKTTDFLPVLTEWGATSDQAIVSAITGEMIGADLRADLAKLETEALIMVPFDAAMGVSRDQIEDTYKTQYEAAPSASFDLIDNSFHFIMIDQPDAFHARLLNVLAD